MSDTAVNELSPELQSLAAQARVALGQGNYDYVIEVSGQILKSAPGCLAVRRLWRTAQMAEATKRNPWGGGIRGLLVRIAPWRGRSEMARADAMLAADPRSQRGLMMLATAARDSGFPETALFALESLCEVAPQDLSAGILLVEALFSAGKLAEALVAVERVLTLNPHAPEASMWLRKISVAQTVKAGNWEGEGSFRDKLRD